MMGTSAHHVLSRLLAGSGGACGARDSQHVGPEPIDG